MIIVSPTIAVFDYSNGYLSEQTQHLNKGKWLAAFLWLSVWLYEMVRKEKKEMCSSAAVAAFKFRLPQYMGNL